MFLSYRKHMQNKDTYHAVSGRLVPWDLVQEQKHQCKMMERPLYQHVRDYRHERIHVQRNSPQCDVAHISLLSTVLGVTLW